MINTRIYVAKIQEIWEENSIKFSKSHFKILFNKDKAYHYCMSLAHQKNNEYHSIKDEYDIDITVYEYSYESYYFDYIDGLVLYFNESINSNEYIYDNILKCIECNVFEYDLNGNLINSYVYPSTCKKTGITFWDFPLSEDECINNKYCSKFKYYMHTKPNILLATKQITYGLKIIYMKNNLIPYNNSDSGIYDCLFMIRGSIDEAFDIIKQEIISLAEMYSCGMGIDINNINDAVTVLKYVIKDYSVEIYDVSHDSYKIIYKSSDILRLLEV